MLGKGDLAQGYRDISLMAAMREESAGANWRKLAVLMLAVAAVGLPLNNIVDYALLVIVAVVVFTGEVSVRPRSWAAALVIVVAAVVAQAWLAPPRIVEGHNVFLPSPALERALPGDVYRHMAAEFDALYPPDKRCDPKAFGCWQ